MTLSKGLKVTALALMGLLAAFLSLMGIGEMAGGDFSGIGHLFPALFLIGMVWLGWKKPFGSGIFLLVIGTLNTFVFSNNGRFSQENLIALLIMAVPFFVSGGLLLGAALLEQTKPPQNHHL